MLSAIRGVPLGLQYYSAICIKLQLYIIITSRRGQDSPWKSQSEWQRTGINGESTSAAWPTLGSRTAKEQNRTLLSLSLRAKILLPRKKKFPAVPLVSNLCSPCRVTEHTPFGGRLSLAIMCKHMASSVKTESTLSQCRQTRTDPRTWTGTSAGFWLGGQCPPCHLRRRKFWKFDYELVHSEVYLNKYVVSIAPFSTPACPDCSQNIT